MKKNKLFTFFMALLCAICCSLNAYAGAPDSGKRGAAPGDSGGGIEIGDGGGAVINPTTPEQEPPHTNPTSVEGPFSYTGSPQTLFNGGTTHESTVMYYKVTMTSTKPTTDPKTTPSDWSTSIAQQTNAGLYYLWFYIDGRDSYIDVDVNDNPITNEIQKVPSSVTTAPTAVSEPFVYNGYSKNLFNTGTASGGTMKYNVTTINSKPSTDASGWTTSISNQTNAGTYYLWYYVEGDGDHLDTEVLGPVTKELQKGIRSYTKPSVNGSSSTTSWTGSAQTLFNAGSNTGTATLMYLVNESNTQPSKSDEGWGTSIPQKTDIGTYRLWYYLVGGDNYEDTEINSSPLSKNIVKAYPSVTAPVAKTIPYDGESHELITAGTTSLFTMEYRVNNEGDWSSSVPSATAIGDYTVSYRVVPDDPEHYNTYGPSNVYAHIKAPVASITTSADVTTLYTDFNDALISAWVDGSTLKLLKAAETGSWYTLNNKGNITLDLNGFGIKSTSGQSEYATFNLSGTTNLTIIDSNPTATHKFEKDEYDNYATLNETSGNITISGGYITGAPRSAFNVGSGSTLTMNAGTLIGNHSYYTGAAVNVGGTFTMNGGAIMHNYSDQSGTGVYVESNATFKLYGGSITYNLTNGGQGAGVGTSSAANFYMHGQPEIRYNQTLYGEASNVYLHYDEYGERSNDVVIQIDDDLNQSERYRVGIQSGFHANSGSFVFTSGLDSHSGGASDIHKFFSNDQGYYPIRQSYYDSNEAELYKGSTTLETPTTPTVNGPYTYDGSSHAMLSAPSVSNGGVIKYQYRFRTHSGSYPAWEETWYTYATLPTVTNAGVYQIRAKAFANSAPGYSDSSTSSSATFTISKANSTVTTPPTGLQLAYTGNEQNLVTAGIVDHTYMVYSTNNSTWHQEIPKATLPGTYTIYYGAKETDNYNGEYSQSMHVITTIAGVEVYDNADPTSTLTNINGVAGMSLIVHRTIYADGEYNTICLPFSMTAEQIAASPLNGYERLKAFRSACVSGTGQELTIDILVDNATSIEAGVPYLISYPSAHTDIVDPVFTGIEVTTTEPSNASANGVTFQGMFQQVHIDSYTADRKQDFLFLGSNSQLAWPLDDGTFMRGFRAYFIIDRQTIPSEVAPRGTRARIVERTEVTTAISTVQSNEPQSTKVLQNGQLYIIRGKHMYNAQGQMVK